ncbi:hypothetical protein B566_EDAN009050 [Ephemera danica]|nr:hypothetical protein B566_EDAN009050 [Ephemera danica]
MPDAEPAVNPPSMVVGQLLTLKVADGGRPTPEAWELFCDKMDSFFRVNAVPAANQRDWLLSCPGDYIISTLKKLKSNREAFLALTYAQAIQLLNTHIEPPKSKFYSRIAIYSRKQAKGERVREYVAELCKLAADCGFRKEDFDLEVLCVLVCNMRDLELQQRLWSQPNLTLDSAVLQIEASESASDYLVKMRNVSNVNASSSNVQTINKANHYRAELKGQQQQSARGAHTQQQRVTSQAGASSSSSLPKCWRCDRGRHAPADCRYKTAKCNFCGNVGHIKPACRKFKGQGNKGGVSQRVQNVVVDQGHEPSVEDYWNSIDWCLSVHPVLNNDSSDNIPKPCLITILINQVPLNMEIDSGSGVSFIGRDIYDSCFRDIPMRDPQLMLKAWNSSTLPVSGQINVTATLGHKSAELPLLIMATRGSSLLGRQWFAAVGIQSPSPASRVLHASPLETSTLDATRLPDQIKEFGTCLFDSSLGTYSGPPVRVHLRTDAVPQFRRARPVALAVRDRASVAVDSLLGTVLSPTCHSQWASPAVYVIKPSGDVRLCIDYSSTVNAHIDRDVYPLPSVDEMLSRLSGQSHYTKLDLRNAFLQLTVDDATSKLLTVNNHKGLFNVLRMPPGLSSAPAIFQRTLESQFGDLEWVVIYLDDMVITAQSESQIWERTRQVMARLLALGLNLRLEKYLFAVKVLPFIGYIVSVLGVKPSDEKIRPLLLARSPSNRNELQVYLGAINYYDRFFANKSHHFHPLYLLLRAGTPWRWTVVVEQAIQFVRNTLSSHVIDHEATAVLFGLKKCRFYCAGRKVTIIVDHKPLTGIFRGAGKPIPEVLSPRILRLCLEAAAFDYTFIYREGKKHANADFCSRFPVEPAPASTPEEPAIVMFVSAGTQGAPVFADAIARETAADPLLSQVVVAIERGIPRQKLSKELRAYVVGQPGALAVQAGCILFGARVVIPAALRPQVLQRLHQHHQGIVKTKAVARSYCWWPQINSDIENLVAVYQVNASVITVQRLEQKFSAHTYKPTASNLLSLHHTTLQVMEWPNEQQYLQGRKGEKWLPGVVVGCEGTRILTIQCPDRSIVRRHLDQVRRRSPCMDNDPRSCSQEDDIAVKAALAAAEAARERYQ